MDWDEWFEIEHKGRRAGKIHLKSHWAPLKAEVQDQAEATMRRLSEAIAMGNGATASVRYERRYPPTVNDARQTEVAAAVAEELVGAENVERNPSPVMGSEDFSFMLNEVRGCYINIGNGDGEGACEVHNPSYDFNDQALPYGASFFARLVEKRLAK